MWNWQSKFHESRCCSYLQLPLWNPTCIPLIQQNTVQIISLQGLQWLPSYLQNYISKSYPNMQSPLQSTSLSSALTIPVGTYLHSSLTELFPVSLNTSYDFFHVTLLAPQNYHWSTQISFKSHLTAVMMTITIREVGSFPDGSLCALNKVLYACPMN